MSEVISKNKCTGCTACMNACPKKAIKMTEEKGFLYPIIDKNKCINCNICKKICPVINTSDNQSINKCYIGYSKEVDDLSSSGGLFQIIAKCVLENNGIVIGSGFENNKLKHIAISNVNELDTIKGSKYLQSELKNIFSYIKENIEEKEILFVGTPCQVAGLKAFLKKDYKNLICVDLFCHGVPSPRLFYKYIEELEEQHNDKVVNYNFRDKKTGWDTYSNTITFKNKIISELQIDNNYMKLFLSDVALRESCYNCNFKLGNKYSDITLGDFWGVQNYYPDMYNKKGVSAIIINTRKGQEIFDKIKDKLIYKKCKLDEILNGNPSLKKSAFSSKKRKKFFDDINRYDINYLTKKYAKPTITIKIINKFKRLKYHLNRLIK